MCAAACEQQLMAVRHTPTGWGVALALLREFPDAPDIMFAGAGILQSKVCDCSKLCAVWGA